MSVSFSLSDRAETFARQMTGITTTFWIRRSFIRTNIAAALDGIHLRIGRLPELVVLLVAPPRGIAPSHLFSLDATSHEVNWSMSRWGSGCVIVVVYIWRSVAKWG